MDRQGDAIDQTVRHLDGMNRKWPDAEALIGPDLVQLRLLEQPVLFQFVLDIGQGEFGGIHRYIQFAQQVRKPANMIFVTVSDHYAANVLAIFDQVSEVRNNDIDAQQFGFGEHQAGIDDDDVVGPAHGHAVHAELAKASKRNDVEFTARHRKFDASTRVASVSQRFGYYFVTGGRAQVAFPACDHSTRQAIADHIHRGAQHVHQLIDAEKDESTLYGKPKLTDGGQQDHETPARNPGNAFAGKHQRQHHHELLPEAHVDSSNLGNKDRSQSQIQRPAIHVKAVAGGDDEGYGGARYPEGFHGFHRARQCGFRAGGGEGDGGRLGDGAEKSF